jgi:hypothetical protein
VCALPFSFDLQLTAVSLHLADVSIIADIHAESLTSSMCAAFVNISESVNVTLEYFLAALKTNTSVSTFAANTAKPAGTQMRANVQVLQDGEIDIQ